jgi:hypothetical protein
MSSLFLEGCSWQSIGDRPRWRGIVVEMAYGGCCSEHRWGWDWDEVEEDGRSANDAKAAESD